MNCMNALVSWSGGKDSCLALWRAQQSGLKVTALLTALDETGLRTRSHGVSRHLIEAQAAALGVAVHFISATWADYEAQFTAALREAHADGISVAVFGDIDLLPHREWEEKVCAQAGLRAVLPLWDESRRALVDEFWATGFAARVVCVDGRHLSAAFVGRAFDAAYVQSLPHGVDACGENGEFHTFVTDGPNFAKPVSWVSRGVHSVQAPAEFGGHTYHFDLLDSSAPEVVA
ncbi:MAG: hypothetical protein RLZZ126_6 [Pseudomonadota bacterium]|jgi:uncharacterized protein (TIGR00290 family)